MQDIRLAQAKGGELSAGQRAALKTLPFLKDCVDPWRVLPGFQPTLMSLHHRRLQVSAQCQAVRMFLSLSMFGIVPYMHNMGNVC